MVEEGINPFARPTVIKVIEETLPLPGSYKFEQL